MFALVRTFWEVTMELEMHPHQWERSKPDWASALVAGLVAGAVLMVLDLLWTSVMASGATWRSSHLVAAIVLGPETATGSGFSLGVVATALITHYLLGIVFACVLAYIVAGFHYERSGPMIETIGAAFGVGVYLISMYGWALVFPWIAELRGWGTFIGHIAFGLVAAMTYWKLVQGKQAEG
ncbi:MAG TPA: hypothetical protein VGE47_15575 [Burkholderiaceae bacterium]